MGEPGSADKDFGGRGRPMRSTAIVWAVLIAGTVTLSSCEESASPQHAKAHAPALAPAPTAQFATIDLPQFPERASLLGLTDTRPRIDILVATAQARFDAAQKEYKAVVGIIQESGFQPDADPRLSELLDQTGEALHSYDVNAEQDQEADEGDDAAQTPANPLDAF